MRPGVPLRERSPGAPDGHRGKEGASRGGGDERWESGTFDVLSGGVRVAVRAGRSPLEVTPPSVEPTGAPGVFLTGAARTRSLPFAHFF